MSDEGATAPAVPPAEQATPSEHNGGSAQPAAGGPSRSLVATATAPEPVVAGIHKRERRYGKRFMMIYAVLILILGGAIAGVFLSGVHFGGNGSSKSGDGWSNWQPQNGTRAAMAKEIADHVAHEYKLNKAGAQLLAIVSEPPLVTSGTHKVSISNIAIQTKMKTGKVINVVPSTNIWADEFCGIRGQQCAIAGKASETRGRLVRREALEVALYTFKYVPTVNTVVAFMPPPAGTQPTVLFLRKASLTKQLTEPLRKTLVLAKPPLPTQPDPTEQATIDRLTLPSLYTYTLQQLQDSSALLVLNPFQS